MAYLKFKRFQQNGEARVGPTGQNFVPGGRNLIYQAWNRRARPLDEGWHVSARELMQIDGDDPAQVLLVVDWNPSAETYIGLAELLDVHAYTFGSGGDEPMWTPVMFRMRSLLEENVENAEQKRERLNAGLLEPDPDEPDFVSFLYLAGERNGWRWGRGRGTNTAAFLEGGAREYFRRFF